MGRTIEIKMDSDDMIQALVERVGYWTDDSDVIELFEQFYENRVEGGCFDGSEFDVMYIVDNDYVNNTSIITREEFEEARDKYIEEQIKALDEPDKEVYEDEDEYQDALNTYNEEVISVEGEACTWEDIEYGENNIEFLEGSYVEAKTDSCLLVS